MFFFVKITWFLSFSGKNDAESIRNFINKSVLDPKRAKLDPKSDFGHVHEHQKLQQKAKPSRKTLLFKRHHNHFLMSKQCFLDSSTQNHAESSSNFLNKSVWDPKCAKFNQNSDIDHVRTYSWLHKLRNTRGKRCGTYLENSYGIYKDYP